MDALKIPAASCRESSILKVELIILIARYPRKLQGTRSLLDLRLRGNWFPVRRAVIGFRKMPFKDNFFDTEDADNCYDNCGYFKIQSYTTLCSPHLKMYPPLSTYRSASSVSKTLFQSASPD